jgi:RNA-directed DNA polymerase
MRPDRPRDLARRIAKVMLIAPRDEMALREAIAQAFGPLSPSLIVSLARLLPEHGRVPDAGSDEECDRLVERMLADARFRRAATSRNPPRVRRLQPVAAIRAPARLLVAGLPAIESPADLARWLGLDAGDLLWLSDPWGQETRHAEGPLRHYRYHWRAREYGPDRLIESPKQRLRSIQRRIHAQILSRMPVHDAAHGFVRGRSAVTHARMHAGRACVARIDLEQFFPGITAVRVRGVFELPGYAPAVARLLAALCTNRVPTTVLNAAPHGPPAWADRQRFAFAHLPQGAPSSPLLANLVAWRLDARLAGWSARRGLVYSRYADDLTFSGDLSMMSARAAIERIVTAIVEDCGFRVNARKTCWFGQQQAQRITGIVVNRHANIARSDFDRLKAILTNCVRHGPADQNREGHADFRAWLCGMLAWFAGINAARTEKLRRLFDRIEWTAP